MVAQFELQVDDIVHSGIFFAPELLLRSLALVDGMALLKERLRS
jgi:hypothetical protein